MTDSGYGHLYPTDTATDFDALCFIVEQLQSLVRTAIPVKVMAVRGGGIAPVGFVDVLPMVNMMDGSDNAYPHGTVSNLPYFRLQGGFNAVICDPAVGDIGLAVICDRDISAVKATRKVSNPGSHRQSVFPDGIYLGAILGMTPKQYVAFTETGLSVLDVNGNTIVTGPDGVTINGVTIDRSGNVKAAGDVIGDSDAANISLVDHLHSDAGGTGESGPPVSGT